MIISWLLLFANINSTQASTVFEQTPKQAESKSETASDATVEAVQKIKPNATKANSEQSATEDSPCYSRSQSELPLDKTFAYLNTKFLRTRYLV